MVKDFSFKAKLEGSRGLRTMQAWCFEGVGEATSALSEATASPPVNSRFSCRWFYHKVNFQS